MARRKNLVKARLLETPFGRVATRVRGFDALVGGGLLRGGTYLFVGAPGTGKTILANQVAYDQVRRGQRVLFVTLLAESHNRMMGNLRSLSFFTGHNVGDAIQYISGYPVLEKSGLEGLLKLLADSVARQRANLLVIDGIASADEIGDSPVSFKKFVHNLNSIVGLSGCTTLLLSSRQSEHTLPEYTMVDGIINLAQVRTDMSTIREIEVVKFRGSSHIFGRHFYEITSDGLSIYPRLESIHPLDPPPVATGGKKLAIGIPTIEKLMGGGLVPLTVTTLLGPGGTGKSSLGMAFLAAGARRRERSLLMSFYEAPLRIEKRLADLGLDLGPAIKSGHLLFWQRQAGQHLLDKMLAETLELIEAKGVRRLFIDGVDGLRSKMIGGPRFVTLMIAFVNRLRALGVTTLITDEVKLDRQLYDGELSCYSAIADNILEFHHVEIEGERSCAFGIVKTRDGDCDRTIHELIFAKDGPVKLGVPLRHRNANLLIADRVTHAQKERGES